MDSHRTQVNILALVVLSLFLFHLEGLGNLEGVKGYPPSVTCATYECAPYQVIYSQKEFEIRIYNKSTWISSSIITSKSYNDAVRDGFITLLNYIEGYNRDKVTLNMTAPVLIDILPKSSFEVHLYVPKNFQKNPPAPYENQQIKSLILPINKYAVVTRFSGYLNDVDIAMKLEALKKNLQGTPWQSAAASVNFSAADFNPPWQSKGRVNEIILWFDKN